MNPEFVYRSSKEPVPEEAVREYLERKRKRLLHEFPNGPEMVEILSNVRFELLRELFATHIHRSGTDLSVNLLDQKSIHAGGLGPTYFSEENLIALPVHSVKERFTSEHLKLGALKLLTHEETHAVSKVQCVGLRVFEKDAENLPWVAERQTGYDQINSETGVRLGERFNEGVTEKLSQEVFINYLERDPDYASIDEKAAFFAYCDAHPELMPYTDEVALVNALITRIARDSGLPEDFVWTGIVRGMMEGERLEDDDLKEAFADMFSPDFLDRLKGLRTDEQHEQLLNEIKVTEQTSVTSRFNLFKKLAAWLRLT